MRRRGIRFRTALLAATLAAGLGCATQVLAQERSTIAEEDLPPPSAPPANAPGAEDPGWDRRDTPPAETHTHGSSGGAAGAVEGSMEHAGEKTKGGLEKAGEATGKALDKAITKTGEGVGYVIDKTGDGLRSAGEALSGER
jgi:hypothetical protein